MTGVARRTVSIPDDLDKRMDRVPKSEDVNWSQIAAAAFEAKLAEIASRKREKTMDDVVQRLKASVMTPKDKLYQEGYSVGENWARHTAEWPQLQRLGEARHSADFEKKFADKDWGGANGLLIAINPELRGAGLIRTWEEFFGEGREGAIVWTLARGFWDAATMVYDHVKGKI